MVTKRLELRLDEEFLRDIERVAREEGKPLSEIARRFMGVGYEDWLKARRKLALQRILEANIEDVPEPDVLKRQLESAYDIPDPYRR